MFGNYGSHFRGLSRPSSFHCEETGAFDGHSSAQFFPPFALNLECHTAHGCVYHGFEFPTLAIDSLLFCLSQAICALLEMGIHCQSPTLELITLHSSIHTGGAYEVSEE